MGNFVIPKTTSSPTVPAGGTFGQILAKTNEFDFNTQWINNTDLNAAIGTGTINYLSKFTGSNTLGDSLLFDNGTNVGIGTTTPISTLDVNGQVSIKNGLNFFKATTNIVESYNADASNYQDLLIKANSYDFSIGAVNKLFISSAGNVGIGTTTPSVPLEIGKSLGIQGKIRLWSGNVQWGQIEGGDSILDFNVNNQIALTVSRNGGHKIAIPSNSQFAFSSQVGGSSSINYLDSGISRLGAAKLSIGNGTVGDYSGTLIATNIGIGTTTPLQKLDVVGTIRATTEASVLGNVTGGLIAQRTSNDSVLYFGFRTTPDAWVIGASYATTGAYKPIILATSDTARMSVLANGNVGIGTTAPGNMLDVGSVTNGGNVGINGTESADLLGPLSATGWSLGTGWVDNGNGTLTHTGTTSGSIIALAPLASVVVGGVYKTVVTLASTKSSAYMFIGGYYSYTFNSLTGTFTFYTIATTTTAPAITASGAGSITISSISIKRVTNGDLLIYGKARFANAIYNAFGQKVIDFNSSGKIGLAGADASNSGYGLSVNGHITVFSSGVYGAYFGSHPFFMYMDGTNKIANFRSEAAGSSPVTIRAFTAYTDANNYERMALTGVAGVSVNLNAETAGTGGDNLNIVLTPAGTGYTLLNGNVGIGTITPSAKLDILDTVLAGSAALAGSVLNLAQTWNTTGVPTAIKLNVTNTASGTNSLLFDFQTDSVSQLALTKDGRLNLKQGGAISTSGGNINLRTNLGGGSGYNVDVASYNTFNTSSNPQGFISLGGSIAYPLGTGVFKGINVTYTINNPGVQTGTATGIFLNATETALNGMVHNLMDLQVGGVSKFSVTNAGIGNFLSTVYAGGNFVASAYLYINAKSGIGSVTDGNFELYNNARTSFGRLNLGGTTSSFPAIKRNGAEIDFRLADDSGYVNINSNTHVIYHSGDRAIEFVKTGANGYSIEHDVARIYFYNRTTAQVALRIINNGSVSVGNLDAVASALFQIDSTTKGFLPPRMTTAQILAIVSPANGLEVYNTDIAAGCFWDGTAWRKISHSAM